MALKAALAEKWSLPRAHIKNQGDTFLEVKTRT